MRLQSREILRLESFCSLFIEGPLAYNMIVEYCIKIVEKKEGH